MLGAFTGFLNSRQHRKRLEDLRRVVGAFTELIGIEGATLMVRIDSRIRSQLERRFGADREIDIFNDNDLKREEQRIEFLPPEKLFEMSRNFSLLAERSPDSEDIAEAMSWRLLSVWLEAKAIARQSGNKQVVSDARGLEEICFSHIKSLLRLLRGERASD